MFRCCGSFPSWVLFLALIHNNAPSIFKSRNELPMDAWILNIHLPNLPIIQFPSVVHPPLDHKAIIMPVLSKPSLPAPQGKSIIRDAATSEDADLELRCHVALSCLVTSWLKTVDVVGDHDEQQAQRCARKYLQDKKEEAARIFAQSPSLASAGHETLVRKIRPLVMYYWRHENEGQINVDSNRPQHRQIFDHLAVKCQTYRGYLVSESPDRGKQYSNAQWIKFFQEYNPDYLFRLLQDGTGPEIWKECVVGHKAVDPRYLATLEEDFNHRHGGWYLILMWDKKKKFYDWYRAYVGQAGSGQGSRTIVQRAFVHMSNSTNLSFREILYLNWRYFSDPIDDKRYKEVKFVRLGSAPEPETFKNPADADLFLNLGEMFYSLIFRSLQVWDLQNWLPYGTDVDLKSTIALNVALPLNQGNPYAANASWASLVNSPDPKVSQYVYDKLVNNLSAVHNGDWVTNNLRMRMISTNYTNKVLRNRHPGQTVRVKCPECDHEKDDKHTSWLMRTGEYVMRLTICHGCRDKSDDPKSAPRRVFQPHGRDADISKVAYAKIRQRIRYHEEWMEYYTFNRNEVPSAGVGSSGRAAPMPRQKRQAALDSDTEKSRASKKKKQMGIDDMIMNVTTFASKSR